MSKQRKATPRPRVPGELKYRAALKVIDDEIAGFRKSINHSLNGTRSLRKTHKDLGAPFPKDLQKMGTDARKGMRYLMRFFVRIRSDMRKAARDAQRKDRDDHRKGEVVR
jgi:hypothetical protein